MLKSFGRIVARAVAEIVLVAASILAACALAVSLFGGKP
jgi:hypothetical protein